jgi:hypothetical protein
MKLPITGGCVCGAIRYECTAEPLMMGNCHCRDSQRVSGESLPYLFHVHVATIYRVTQEQ